MDSFNDGSSLPIGRFAKTEDESSIILRKIIITVLVAMLVFLAALLIAQSGLFAREPKITVKPDNCYEETLRVITDEDYCPYSFYDSEGNVSGHDVELIILIANKLHMNLDLKLMNWYKGIDEITEGNADVLMTCDYSDTFAGVDRLIKSEPISYDDFIVYSKSKINSPDMLYGKRIGVMKDGNAIAQIRMMDIEKYCIGYEDNRQAMEALIRNEVDAVIMRQTIGTVLLQELDADGIKGYISIGESYMCFGIFYDDPELTNKINLAIEELKISGELSELRNKWLTTFIRPYTLTELLTNNIWLLLMYCVLLGVTIIVLIWSRLAKIKADEERFLSALVMEELAQDFICVNYVEITDDADTDPVINYRVSKKLINMIPGWENEKRFQRKLVLLRDNLVYEADREQFELDVDREHVIDMLEESDAYFVNLRAFIDGDIKYYQMKFAAVRSGRRLVGIVVGLHSVDEETKKEMALMEQLQEALQKATVADRSKSDFLFNMSHDIRTPLNAILGFTNMAVKHIDEKERVLDCLKKAQQSGSLLLSLINSILDVSRIESGKAVLDESVGDVMLSFVSIEDTMRELAASAKIDISFEIGDVKDRYIFTDINRCNRVLVNMISNSIKYSKEGGYVKVRVDQIGKAHDGVGLYRYVVEDNGIGMSEEFQKHVFEQFSRAKNVTMSGIQGTGLGMTVCKSFVELMGGTIECRSKLGKGTTFTVTLPFKLQNDNKYIDPITGDVVSAGEQRKEHAVADFRGKRVLLTEDNELNREIITDILEDRGFFVEEAIDGVFAVEMLKDKGPKYYDVILIDIQMPVMNGYEATKAIREMYPNDHIPIIALSANAFSEDRAASLAAGMDDHVAKPINIEELYSAIERQLS